MVIKRVMKKITSFLIAIAGLTACSGSPPELGVNNGLFYPCPTSPNCVSSQAEKDDVEHFIQAIIYQGDLVTTRERLVNIIRVQKNATLVVTNNDYVLAEFTSSVFRFVDDVEFYLIPKSTETVIEVRSLSRVGYSDFGVNRNRIENIRQLMQ